MPETDSTHLANPQDIPAPKDEAITGWQSNHIRDLVIDVPISASQSEVERLKDSVPETGIESYDKRAQEAVRRATKVLDHTRKLVEEAEAVREKNVNDPLQDNLTARVNTYRYFNHQVNKINDNVAGAKKEIRDIATDLDNSINTLPPKSETEIEYGKQYRDHIKSLPVNERWSFVSERLESEDLDVVHAVLRSRPFLSGLDEGGVKQLRDLYKKQRYPRQIEARDQLQEVLGYLWETQQAVSMKAEGLKNNDVTRAIRKNSEAISMMGDVPARIYR